MNRESCIQTIELLRQLALNIHGVIDVIDDRNCNDIINLLKEHDNCENCAIAIEDRQPIVRCKDCKNNNQCSIQFKFADADNPGNWFCAYGKRKEGR